MVSQGQEQTDHQTYKRKEGHGAGHLPPLRSMSLAHRQDRKKRDGSKKSLHAFPFKKRGIPDAIKITASPPRAMVWLAVPTRSLKRRLNGSAGTIPIPTSFDTMTKEVRFCPRTSTNRFTSSITFVSVSPFIRRLESQRVTQSIRITSTFSPYCLILSTISKGSSAVSHSGPLIFR